MNDQQQTPQNNNSGGIFGSPLMTNQVAGSVNNSSNQNTTQDESNSIPLSISDLGLSDQINNQEKNVEAPTSDFPVPENQNNEVVEEQQELKPSDQNQEVPHSQNSTDQLKDLGVTVVDDQIDSSHKTNVFDQNSSFASQSGIENNSSVVVDSELQDTSKDINQKEDDQDKNLETKDLEADFSEAFGGDDSEVHQEIEDVSLDDEERKLQSTYDKLKEKADAEKILIKKDLEKLKEEKEQIGKRLEKVKEIENIALKIKDKIESLKTLDQDIDSLEERAHQQIS